MVRGVDFRPSAGTHLVRISQFQFSPPFTDSNVERCFSLTMKESLIMISKHLNDAQLIVITIYVLPPTIRFITRFPDDFNMMSTLNVWQYDWYWALPNADVLVVFLSISRMSIVPSQHFESSELLKDSSLSCHSPLPCRNAKFAKCHSVLLPSVPATNTSVSSSPWAHWIYSNTSSFYTHSWSVSLISYMDAKPLSEKSAVFYHVLERLIAFGIFSLFFRRGAKCFSP